MTKEEIVAKIDAAITELQSHGLWQGSQWKLKDGGEVYLCVGPTIIMPEIQAAAALMPISDIQKGRSYPRAYRLKQLFEMFECTMRPEPPDVPA